MTPPRLHRKVEKKPPIPKLYLIQFIMVLLAISISLIFLWVCFTIVPQTQGFYWW